MREETTHSTEEGVAKKHARTERIDTERDTECGGELGTSQLQSKHKKGHMTNIYLTDSHEGAIVDFLKDHKKLYNKTKEYLKDMARKECLWERFANSCKLSIKVFKAWLKSQRTLYHKLMHAVKV